jgi:hypothetical protein
MTELVAAPVEILVGLAAGFAAVRAGGRYPALALGVGALINAAILVYAASTNPKCTSTIDCEPITTGGWVFLGIAVVGGWCLLVAVGAALAMRFPRTQDRTGR